jgi:hypothetical protein
MLVSNAIILSELASVKDLVICLTIILYIQGAGNFIITEQI